MKQLRVELLESALTDLRETRNFIARQSRSKIAARNYLARVETFCARLGNAPGIGSAREQLGPGLKSVGFERSATIVFREQPDRLQIVNVFYGGRDIAGFYRRQSAPE